MSCPRNLLPGLRSIKIGYQCHFSLPLSLFLRLTNNTMHITGPHSWMTQFALEAAWAGFASLFVLARIATRYSLGPDRLAYDDWILLAAWLTGLLRMGLTWASWPWGGPLLILPVNPAEVAIYHHREVVFGASMALGYATDGLCKAAVTLFLIRLTMVKW